MSGTGTEYCVEYAKSGRSSCKVCKAKIDQGELRLGISSPGPGDVSARNLRAIRPRRPTHPSDVLRAPMACLTLTFCLSLPHST